MPELPKPRTWILSAEQSFDFVKDVSETEAEANGWDVKVEEVVVDGQDAALVTFSVKAAAARLSGVHADAATTATGAVGTRGGPYIAARPEAWLGQVVTTGQCVAYVQTAAGAPNTSFWRRGNPAKDNPRIAVGTVIATFDPNGTYGNHTDGRSHAAVYIDQNKAGLFVYDQWIGQPVHKRLIRFGGAKPVNDGNAFSILL